ncbi:MAG: polysaccharide pyruvyl transferase family protein [bacterium]|nr:polysaccharide pyruvyl transferase family protein [bacterium]
MKCLLIGNFGVGNLGDQALKDYFLQEFSEIEWTVISAHPTGGEVARLPAGIRSFLGGKWLSTISAYRQSDAVVFGGGSLFTDTESVYACCIWWVHAQLAFLLKKPVHLAFQGIGPFRTRLGTYLTSEVCRKSASISVRDSLSYNRVGELVMGKKCVQSFDPVFSLIESQKIDVCTKNILVVIPRKNSSDNLTMAVQELIKSMSPEQVKVLSMQPDKKSESDYCQMLAKTIGTSSRVIKVRTLNNLILEISSAGFVISERYHGALAALALGKEVKIISQCDGDKLSTLSQIHSEVHQEIISGLELLHRSLIIE